jgi:hypothetical protein
MRACVQRMPAGVPSVRSAGADRRAVGHVGRTPLRRESTNRVQSRVGAWMPQRRCGQGRTHGGDAQFAQQVRATRQLPAVRPCESPCSHRAAKRGGEACYEGNNHATDRQTNAVKKARLGPLAIRYHSPAPNAVARHAAPASLDRKSMSQANELKDDVQQLWRQLSELRQQVDELTSRVAHLESTAARGVERLPHGGQTGAAESPVTTS